MENLSAHLAMLGINSPIWVPGTLVGIGRNSPRISEGALGFKSYMSMWLGPPNIHKRMQFTSRFGLAVCCARKTCGRLKPSADNPPKRSASRRETAFQELNWFCPATLVLTDYCSAIINLSQILKRHEKELKWKSLSRHGRRRMLYIA